jgi:hypothetical protein
MKVADLLISAESDIMSVTRADSITILDELSSEWRQIDSEGPVSIGLQW